jgi:hypothetical protein
LPAPDARGFKADPALRAEFMSIARQR